MSNVPSDKRVGGKGHAVDSRLCRNKKGFDVVALKGNGVCRDEPNVVDAPTDVEVDLVVADALSES